MISTSVYQKELIAGYWATKENKFGPYDQKKSIQFKDDSIIFTHFIEHEEFKEIKGKYIIDDDMLLFCPTSKYTRSLNTGFYTNCTIIENDEEKITFKYNSENKIITMQISTGKSNLENINSIDTFTFIRTLNSHQRFIEYNTALKKCINSRK